jgi:hypothetical protein
MFNNAAPAPNSAAAPTAPVIIGIAPAVDEADSDAWDPAPPVGVESPIVVVGAGTPEVNGSSSPGVAPSKEPEPCESSPSSRAVELSGFRTLANVSKNVVKRSRATYLSMM